MIDQYEDAFIDFINERIGGKYERHYRRMWGKVVEKVERDGEISQKDIKKLVEPLPITEREQMKVVMTSFMVANFTELYTHKKPKGQQKENLLPFIAIAGLFTLDNPKKAVKEFYTVSDAVIRKDPSKLPPKMQKNVKKVNKYFAVNQEAIKNQARQSVKAIKKTAQTSTANFADDVWKGYKAERFKDVPHIERVETLAKERGAEEWRARRVVETEAHKELEDAKMTSAKRSGLRFKTWKTQQDKRVRETHRKMHGKKIRIDQKFKVGKGTGMSPGNINRPEESISCRCTLIYT